MWGDTSTKLRELTQKRQDNRMAMLKRREG